MWYKFIHRANVVKIEKITADAEYKNEPPITKWFNTKLRLIHSSLIIDTLSPAPQI